MAAHLITKKTLFHIIMANKNLKAKSICQQKSQIMAVKTIFNIKLRSLFLISNYKLRIKK